MISGKESLAEVKTDLLVVPVSDADLHGKGGRGRKAAVLEQVDQSFAGQLRKLLKHQGFEAKDGSRIIFRNPAGLKAGALMLAGWPDGGKQGVFEEVGRYRRLGAAIQRAAGELHAARAALLPADLKIEEPDYAAAFLEGLCLAGYTFNRYKTDAAKTVRVEELRLLQGAVIPAAAERAAASVSAATLLARDLVNTPPRDCSPQYLVNLCRSIGRKNGISVKVYDANMLRRMGAGALLAVGQGSSRPPALVKMTYKPKGKKTKRSVALVGKGITFDSGGLSLKTGEGMMTMKCDMSGAAAVIGVMQALHALKPAVEVRAYLPLAENMPDGDAIKPGDVVKTLSGKTVEILNTDAEGRLILCDALHLAFSDKPDVIIDAATLTGACVVALGEEYAGLFTNDEELAQALTAAGDKAGERFWRLPLAPEYKALLKSGVADIKNIGSGRTAGAITAALFLQNFVGGAAWAHLDIAGPAFGEKDENHISKGATGFGVRTLLRYLTSL